MAGNYAQWADTFDRQIKATLDNATAIHQEAAQRLLKKIEDRTPVGDPSLWKWPAHADYTAGKLKASWTLTSNGNTITIANSMPYAERVEYSSWSTQAPAGMMRVSILDYPWIVEQVARERKL